MARDSLPPKSVQLKDADSITTQQGIPSELPIAFAIPVADATDEGARRRNRRNREESGEVPASQTAHKKLRRLFSGFVTVVQRQRKSQQHARRQRVLGGLTLLATMMVVLMAALYKHACFGPIRILSSTRDGKNALEGGLSKRRLMQWRNPSCPRSTSPPARHRDDSESGEDWDDSGTGNGGGDVFIDKLLDLLDIEDPVNSPFEQPPPIAPWGGTQGTFLFSDATQGDDKSSSSVTKIKPRGVPGSSWHMHPKSKYLAGEPFVPRKRREALIHPATFEYQRQRSDLSGMFSPVTLLPFIMIFVVFLPIMTHIIQGVRT